MRRYVIMSSLVFVLVGLISERGNARDFPAVVEAHVVAMLSSETEGILQELLVKPGDSVKKDQMIAKVRVDILKLEQSQLKARSEYFSFQLSNLKRLHGSGLATDKEINQLEMEDKINKAQIKGIQLQLQRARLMAPFDGKVVEVLANVHEWIQPGQPLVKIYDSSQLYISSDLPTAAALQFTKDSRVSARIEALDQEIITKFIKIVPEVVVQSDTVKTYWELTDVPSNLGLLLGMRMELRLDIP